MLSRFVEITAGTAAAVRVVGVLFERVDIAGNFLLCGSANWGLMELGPFGSFGLLATTEKN